MLYQNALKTLQRKGWTVTRDVRTLAGVYENYEFGLIATKPGNRYQIEVTKQEDEVSTIKVRQIGDNDEIQSDYFGGTFVNSLKRAMEYAERWNVDFVPAVPSTADITFVDENVEEPKPAQAPPPAPKKETANVHIRWMIRRDMPEVLEIEQQSFDYSWTEEDFLRVMRQTNCIGMVAEHGEAIVGYMIYELQKFRIELVNFAVHPQWRRLGVGKQMVEKLVNKLSSHRRNRVTLTVRESNLRAQLFFHAHGFRAERVRRSFFADSGEDAFEMCCRVGTEISADEAEEINNRIKVYEEK